MGRNQNVSERDSRDGVLNQFTRAGKHTGLSVLPYVAKQQH